MSEEALVLLKRIALACESIAATNKVIAEAMGTAGPSAPRAPAAGPATEGETADDADLDSEYGNPTIKFDPRERYWTGPSFVGYHFSETAPDYLDAMAKYLDACAFMAAKESDEKNQKSARYKRKDAARARGWAARLRARGEPNAGAAPAVVGGYVQRPGDAAGVDSGTLAEVDKIPF
jgi:hypothetical protein